MAYTTQQNIVDEFRSLDITTTSIITAAKVARWISEADAYIDSKLQATYSVPITGTKSLLIVSTISTYFVAQRIKNILDNVGSLDEGKNIPFSAMKLANEMLDEYIPPKGEIAPKILLPDASLVSKSPTSGSVMKSGTPTTSRVFTKDGDNW